MAAVSVTFTAILRTIIRLVKPPIYSPGSTVETRTAKLDGFGLESTFDANNPPEPTAVVSQELTLGAAATTIDLTSNANVQGAVDGDGAVAPTEDLTGKKLMGMVMETPSTNVGAVTIKPGAADGYDLWGASIADGVKMQKGEHLVRVHSESAYDAVGATDKNITFDGTEDDVINYYLIFE